jgi:rSAM/selenodomain-associated transferase 2
MVRPDPISVIIPTWNEEATLPETVRRARAVPEVGEVIVADGGSTDRTREVAAQWGCRVCLGGGGRGGQMRLGAAEAVGEVIVLLHADTWLPPEAGRAALRCLQDQRVVGGGFWKVFRDGTWLMRGSRARCWLRFRMGNRFMGDQAMFMRRLALERIGGVPDVPLMEEYELCRGLGRVGRLALADAVVSTSARRFRERGVLRTYWRMGEVTLRYFLGTPPDQLRRRYEQK